MRRGAYPHSGVQGTGNLIILFQSRTATQNLRQPELTDGTFHVLNLPLCRGGRLDPLAGFTANTADHIRMSESLRSPLAGFDIEGRRDGLGDARMQRGGPARNQERIVDLVPSDRTVTG